MEADAALGQGKGLSRGAPVPTLVLVAALPPPHLLPVLPTERRPPGGRGRRVNRGPTSPPHLRSLPSDHSRKGLALDWIQTESLQLAQSEFQQPEVPGKGNTLPQMWVRWPAPSEGCSPATAGAVAAEEGSGLPSALNGLGPETLRDSPSPSSPRK